MAWTDISGATLPSYTIPQNYAGLYLKCVVTDTSLGGTTSASSNVKGAVTLPQTAGIPIFST